MLHFTQREIYCKENLVDIGKADNTNVYPAFMLSGNIESSQLLAVVLLKICDAA